MEKLNSNLVKIIQSKIQTEKLHRIKDRVSSTKKGWWEEGDGRERWKGNLTEEKIYRKIAVCGLYVDPDSNKLF